MTAKRIISNPEKTIFDKDVTEEDLQKELDYYMALIFTDYLFEAELITEGERERIKQECIETFKPDLAPLMT